MNLQRLVVPAFLLVFIVNTRTAAQFTVPDPAFAARLSLMVPAAMNGAVLDTLHPSVAALTYMNVAGAGLTDLNGVQYFTGLQTLVCSNNYLTSMPVLPDAIQELQCQSNGITAFTNLPSSLVVLQCQDNALASLPALPLGLEWLFCFNNGLVALPALPSTLTQLACMYNLLTSLPLLPASLEVLLCNNNSITGTLGPLPAALDRLSCDNNMITAVSALPASLSLLTCAANQLTALPALPASLRELDCDQNSISVMPALPNAMRMLSCVQNQLNALPTLPDSLLQLTCYSNQLAGLPALPAALQNLTCPNNPIGTLPALPSTLVVLYAANNGLSSLPALPNGLTTLFCFNNQLTGLPVLPDSLSLLNCGQNLLTDLPALPAQLQNLLCADNPIACLPVLPNSLSGIVCNNTNVICLPNVPASYSAVSSNLGFPLTVCNVLSPCPFSAEAITGTVFNDTNGNGVKDPGEPAFTNAVIEAQPGGFLTSPDATGNYVLPMVAGTFMLDGQDVQYHTRTTAPANITLTPLQIDSLNDIGYQAIPGVYDLVVDLTTMPARPGFDNTVYLTVENIGTEPAVANMAFTFDATQTWVSSSTAPDTQAGNNATWSATVPVGGSWGTVVTLNTDAGVAIGTPLAHLFTATPSVQDTTPADNSLAWTGMVVGAYDPNDKQVLPEAVSPAQVLAGTKLEYTIRFQNTGTFPAERVIITDTLSTDLLWSTMELVSTSHTTDWYIHQGVLHFVMDPINLPDSASDEPGSHGFVKFRMAPVSTLQNGDQVANVANIYFDFNEPIVTPPAVFTVDLSVGVGANEGDGFSVYPNPVEDLLNVLVSGPGAVLEMHAVDGRLISSQKLAGAPHVLHLDDLRSGLYLVSVVYSDGRRVVQGVVKR
ncbi:MAG: DUF11 domain-containing protein [Flavobacteriales bacterium]|nr:MAG: DUF11 domain-containing protein [Flavobacteriales bacterium]